MAGQAPIHVMRQSIPSANIPPPGQTPGEFFEVVKSPALGQILSAKARPLGHENTRKRGDFLKI